MLNPQDIPSATSQLVTEKCVSPTSACDISESTEKNCIKTKKRKRKAILHFSQFRFSACCLGVEIKAESFIKLLVPVGSVGKIIGIRGAAIQAVIEASGANICLSQPYQAFPGCSDRVAFIFGSVEAVFDACSSIIPNIQSEISGPKSIKVAVPSTAVWSLCNVFNRIIDCQIRIHHQSDEVMEDLLLFEANDISSLIRTVKSIITHLKSLGDEGNYKVCVVIVIFDKQNRTRQLLTENRANLNLISATRTK